MLKKFLIFIFILTFFILQSTLVNYIKVYDAKPNILVILMVSLAFLEGNPSGFYIGIITGLMQDLYFGKFIGYYTLIGLYLGLIVGMLKRSFFKDSYLIVLIVIFLSTICYESCIYITSVLIYSQHIFLSYAFRKILIEAIYNSLLSILIYPIFIRFSLKFEIDKRINRWY